MDFSVFLRVLRANDVITHACFAPMGQGRDFSLSCVTNLLPRWGIDINSAQMINDDTFNLPKPAKQIKTIYIWRITPCSPCTPREQSKYPWMFCPDGARKVFSGPDVTDLKPLWGILFLTLSTCHVFKFSLSPVLWLDNSPWAPWSPCETNWMK